VLVIAYALYAVFFKRAPLPSEIAEPEKKPSAALPLAEDKALVSPEIKPEERFPIAPALEPTPVAAGRITEIKELFPSNAQNARLRADGQGIDFYNNTDNTFYKIALDGSLKQLSTKTFPAVQNVTWAQEKDRAIMEFPDGSNIFFDFDAQKQVTLPKHWEQFSFNPTGEKIATKSISADESKRVLIITRADGSEAKAVASIEQAADQVIPTWSPNNNIIAIAQTGAPVAGGGGDRQNIYLVNELKTGSYPQLTVDGWGFEHQWSTTGNLMAYSVYNSKSNFKPHLWVVTTSIGKEGARKIDTGLETWSYKCSYANDTTLYCAVPQYLEEGFGIKPQLANTIPDDIYKIDLNTNIKTLIGTPQGDFSIEKLMVNKDESKIFFVSRDINGLHEMRLK
jgi:hypothetical protein